MQTAHRPGGERVWTWTCGFEVGQALRLIGVEHDVRELTVELALYVVAFPGKGGRELSVAAPNPVRHSQVVGSICSLHSMTGIFVSNHRKFYK